MIVGISANASGVSLPPVPSLATFKT